MNKKLRRLIEPGIWMQLVVLTAFALATLLFGMYELAAAEAAVTVILLIVSLVVWRNREKQLKAYVESVTYQTEDAKSNTLLNFPLPIAVFRLDDARIVWGNDMFFSMCGGSGARLDASITDLVPQFSGKWLLDGKTRYPTLLELGGRTPSARRRAPTRSLPWA